VTTAFNAIVTAGTLLALSACVNAAIDRFRYREWFDFAVFAVMSAILFVAGVSFLADLLGVKHG
jgi:hypothetical protein